MKVSFIKIFWLRFGVFHCTWDEAKYNALVILLFFFSDGYAVMPPLEQFMEIPSMDRRELFFRDIERGDIVIGRISSIREFGFFMVLICLGSGIIRDISHLEITVSYFSVIWFLLFLLRVLSMQELCLCIQLYLGVPCW